MCGTVHEAPFVEGGASPVLSTDKLDITVKVTTSDGTPVRIEGCTETELTNDTETFERIALIQSVGFTLKKPALPKAITRTLPLPSDLAATFNNAKTVKKWSISGVSHQACERYRPHNYGVSSRAGERYPLKRSKGL